MILFCKPIMILKNKFETNFNSQIFRIHIQSRFKFYFSNKEIDLNPEDVPAHSPYFIHVWFQKLLRAYTAVLSVSMVTLSMRFVLLSAWITVTKCILRKCNHGKQFILRLQALTHASITPDKWKGSWVKCSLLIQRTSNHWSIRLIQF